MSESIVYCFPVENKVRGLDSRLYQGLMCMRKDPSVSCLIGSVNGVDKMMFEMNAPFLYFVKGMNPVFEGMYRRIKDCGGGIIYMDEEGGPSKQDVNPFLLRYAEALLPYIDLICAWGPFQKSVILNNRRNITEDKIVVTGHPRFDLRKPAFEKYYKELRKYSDIIKIPDNYVLFNMNFVIPNSYLEYEELMNMLKTMHEQRVDYPFNTTLFRKAYDYEQLVLNSFIKAIKRLAKQTPQKHIVIRPHPSENISTYTQHFRGCANIHVLRDGSVQEYIIGASCIIHRDCTTAIEAYFFGKPVISYNPVKAPEDIAESYINKIPEQISTMLTEEDELLSILSKDSMEVDVKQSEENNNIIKEVFANIGFDSAEAIVLSVERLIPRIKRLWREKHVQDTHSTLTESMASDKPGLIKSIKSTIGPMYYHMRKNYYAFKNSINSSQMDRRYRVREKAKFPGLNVDELKVRINLFRQLIPDIPEVRVRQVHKDTFHLFRNSN